MAQPSPYCRHVRAKASSEADSLMTPRLMVQGIHFARGAELSDAFPVSGSGYQVRTGLSFSPVDFYKGRSVLRAGDADCGRHEAAVALDDVLGHSTEVARLSALLQQGEFLRTRTEDWRELASRAAARLSQRIITVVEFASIQRSIDTIEHKLIQVEGDAEQLKARQLRGNGMLPGGSNTLPGAAGEPRSSVPELASRFYRESMRFEREGSRQRELDSWKLQVTGGVIPQNPVDWYGTLELSFSLGALIRASTSGATWRAARKICATHGTAWRHGLPSFVLRRPPRSSKRGVTSGWSTTRWRCCARRAWRWSNPRRRAPRRRGT
jgi:hypothetical protein